MSSSRLPARPPARTSQTSRASRPVGVTTTATKPAAARKKSGGAPAGPPNKSILSFFSKVAPPEESMFVAGGGVVVVEGSADVAEQSPAKRRRLSGGEPAPRGQAEATPVSAAKAAAVSVVVAKEKQRRGPFLDDSDDDDDVDGSSGADQITQTAGTAAVDAPPVHGFDHLTTFEAAFHAPKIEKEEQKVNVREGSVAEEPRDEADDYFGLGDGGDDDDFEGEESRVKKYYMEEQALLEAEAAAEGQPGEADFAEEPAATSCCPICSESLAGCSPSQATVHVNACLDGASASTSGDSSAKLVSSTTATATATAKPKLPASNRFAMRAAEPRPGQANPIGLDGSAPGAGTPGSAFSKLMLGHAEDAAWAAAAAAEYASRGRPAYERTCPFYKILPGLAICVDAFRYGAVAGCRAYFLSHFHSDHYVGLTARWCHGPIYCSRVTASLVQSQLGTAARWLVPLDWDAPVDVPGTGGVRVTMIPANHCPGSALFLFETATGGHHRAQRILHCGDFRACPAHVRHPRLRPTLGGRLQQKIDVCYLDTTYLNPRYAFPPQDDVVRACAELCATLDCSLRAGDEAAWNRVLHRRTAGGSSGSGSVRDLFAAAAAAAKKTEPEKRDNNAKQPPAPPPDNALSILGKPAKNSNRLLVVCGTYSIGKERLCKAVALALGSKIFASPAKIKIVAQLGDPELTALMTANPADAQVHMQMLMEIRGETLAEYLATYRAHFARIVGFRPSGWNYRAAAPSPATTASAGMSPSASLPPGGLPTATLLHGTGWRTRFGARDLVPQRGSTPAALCFGVPYSEHSSFRELALFLLALHIERVVPTVNVGSDASRQRMKAWTDRWLAERRRGGLVRLREEGEADEGDGDDDDKNETKLWDGKTGAGGMAYW